MCCSLEGRKTPRFIRNVFPFQSPCGNLLVDERVPLKLVASGTIRIHNQNAAVLICYEQVLVWPFLSSALEHPTILLTISNDYWAKNTRIPAIQQSSVASWARLFHLPVLSASNF